MRKKEREMRKGSHRFGGEPFARIVLEEVGEEIKGVGGGGPKELAEILFGDFLEFNKPRERLVPLLFQTP